MQEQGKLTALLCLQRHWRAKLAVDVRSGLGRKIYVLRMGNLSIAKKEATKAIVYLKSSRCSGCLLSCDLKRLATKFALAQTFVCEERLLGLCYIHNLPDSESNVDLRDCLHIKMRAIVAGLDRAGNVGQ